MTQWLIICLPMLETRVGSLDWEDPLKKEMAVYLSTPAWEVPWTEEPAGAPVHGIAKSQTQFSDSTTVLKGLSRKTIQVAWL